MSLVQRNISVSLVFLLTAFGFNGLYAQHTDTLYFDANWKLSTKNDYEYYRLLNYDKHNKLKQPVTDYYAAGQPQFTATLIMKGQPGTEKADGLATWYYPDGKVQEIQEFKNGKKNGWGEVYYYNDKILYRYEMKDDSLDGDFFRFRIEPLILQSHNYYNKGKRDGIWESYLQSGGVSERSYFKAGTLDSSIGYYETGDLRIRMLYSKRHREEFSYYVNGKPSNYVIWNNDSLISSVSYPFDDNSPAQYRNADTTIQYDFRNRPISVTLRDPDKGTFYTNYIYQCNDLVSKSNSSVTTLYYNTGGVRQIDSINTKTGYWARWIYYTNGKLSNHAVNYNHFSTDTAWDSQGHALAFLADSFNGQILNSRKVIYNDINQREVYQITLPDTRLSIAKDNSACLYGLMNSQKRWIVKPVYTSLSYQNYREETDHNFIIAALGNKTGLLNGYGKQILPVEYDLIKLFATGIKHTDGPFGRFFISDVNYYHNYNNYQNEAELHKFFLLKKDGKFGIADFTGKIVIPIKYNQLAYAEGDLINAVTDSGQALITFNDQPVDVSAFRHIKDIYDPRIITRLSNDSVFCFSYSVSNKAGGYGLKWKNGKEFLAQQILGASSDFCTTDSTQFIGLTSNPIYFLNSHGDTLKSIAGNYEIANHYLFNNETYFAASKNKEKHGAFNTRGEIALPFEYDNLSFIRVAENNYYLIATKDSVAYLFDSHLKNITSTACSSIATIDNSNQQYASPFFVLYNKGQYGFCNGNGQILLPVTYPFLATYRFSDGSIAVCWLQDNTIHCASPYHLQKQIPIAAVGRKAGPGIFFIQKQNINQNHWADEALPALNYDDYNEQAKNETSDIIVINTSGKLLAPIGAKDLQVIANQLKYEWNGQTYTTDTTGKTKPFIVRYNLRGKPAGGYTVVETSSGKLGVINADLKLVLDTAYFIVSIAGVNDGVIWARKTFPPIKDTAQAENAESGEEEILSDENTPDIDQADYIVYDTAGNQLLSDTFILPVCFKPNTTEKRSVSEAKTNTGIGLLQNNFKWIVPPHYYRIYGDKRYGYFAAGDNGIEFYNLKGERLFKNLWHTSGWWNGHCIMAYIDTVVGVIDSTGKIIIPFGHNTLFHYKENLLTLMPSFFQNTDWDIKNDLPKTSLNQDAAKGWANFLVQQCYQLYPTANQHEENAMESMGCEKVVSSLEYRSPLEYYSCSEDSEYNVPEVIAWSDRTLSYVISGVYNYSCTRGMGRSDWYGFFNNFYLQNGVPVQITMPEILKSPQAINDVNRLLRQAFDKVTDPETDCQNLDMMFQIVQDKFSVNTDGLTFYLPKTINTNYGPPDYINLLIPKADIMPLLKFNLWD